MNYLSGANRETVHNTLHCSYCQAEILVEDKHCQECGFCLTKGSKHLLDSPLLRRRQPDNINQVKWPTFNLLAGTITLVLLGILIYWLMSSYTKPCEQILSEGLIRAKHALSLNRFDEVVQVIDETALWNNTSLLSPAQRKVLDQALYARGSARVKAAGVNKTMSQPMIRQALVDLLRIAPQSDKWGLARKLISDNTGARQISGVKAAVSTPKQANHVTLGRDYKMKSAAQLQQDISQLAAENNNDVARYHKLLAGYFGQPHSTPADPPHEPPTLSEWLKQGKPDF